MKALIICPDHRHAAEFARRMRPLALVPVLGRTLLDWWFEKLAADGVKHVVLLAADRPHEIRAMLGQEDTRGISWEVVPVAVEPSVEEARSRFIQDDESAWHPAVITLDTLPSSSDEPLWNGGASLFDAMLRLLKESTPGSRITMREVAPGVHVSTRALIAGSARIEGPAWIGPGVIVAEHARIHPGSVIEESCYIDHHASVQGSWVGPRTYVGALTEISHSFAWGKNLHNWLTGSLVEVTDDFLLGSLVSRSTPSCGWLSRVFALLLWVVTLPFAFALMLLAKWRDMPALKSRRVVLPPYADDDFVAHAIDFHELNGVSGLFARWPELWQVWRGRLRLAGNRPLCPVRASLLDGEFERLWLEAPAGVFSLADALGDDHPDAAVAHSACYSMTRTLRMDLRILMRCLPEFLLSSLAFGPRDSVLPPQLKPHTCP